jgi:hypothetical protein
VIRLAAVLVFLQMADVATTMVGIAAGAVEKNPVGVWLLGAGVWGLLVAKALVTGSILVLAWRVSVSPENGRAWARAMLGWSCLIMAGVVAWNGWVIVA